MLLGPTPTLAQTPALHERIDKAISTAYSGPAAAIASDEEFVRRIYLDLVGRIPSIDEYEAFRSSGSERRSELIDTLLNSPECDRHLATVFDVMLMERRPDKYVTTAEWRRYLVESFAANKPFNQLAAEIIAATGEPADQRGPAKFLLEREVEAHAITRDVSRMLFGRDVQCAQCHDHPIVADYLQSEYYGLQSFLNRTFRFERPVENSTPLSLIAERAEGELVYSSVFEPDAEKVPAMPELADGIALDEEPIFAADQAYQVAGDQQTPPVPRYSRRQQLAELLADGRSDQFRINFANRIWRMLMKRGLIEPPDFVHSGNPASYPLLLTELADAVAEMEFNVKELLRQIALSSAYQRSINLPDSLLEEVDEAAGQLPDRRQELEFEQRVLERAAEAMTRSAEQLRQTRRELLNTRQAIATNLQQMAELQKQRSELEKQRAASQERRVPLASLHDSLQQAAEKSAAASQQRADDEPLRAAAELLRQRADAAQQELAALDNELAQHAAGIEQAERSIAERNEARTALESTLDRLADRAQIESGEFRARKHAHDVEQARVVALRQQVEFAEQRFALRDAELALADGVARCDALESSADPPSADQQQARDALEAELEQARVEVEQLRDGVRRLLEERFLVAAIQPLSPEQLADSVIVALRLEPRLQTEAESQWHDQHKDAAPESIDQEQRRREIEALVDERRRQIESAFVSLFAAAPGSPQDTFFATADQALFIDNDGRMQSWIAPHHENLTAQLERLPSDQEVAEQLYRSILSREPSAEEAEAVAEYLSSDRDNRSAVIQELVWSLLASIEFRFHH